MSAQSFGQIDQTPVFEITIASRAGASAKILTWGAVVRDLVVPASNGLQRVVLGLNTLDDYIAYSPSFGAVPGRFANRIANGRFVLDGVAYQLDRKPGQKHTLHGGPNGFGHRIWKLGAYDDFVCRADHSNRRTATPDSRALSPPLASIVCLNPRRFESNSRRSQTARPSSISRSTATSTSTALPDILDHELTLFADFYTPADEELIPTGEIRAVAGTPYDFRNPRSIRNPAMTPYDTNFVAALEPDAEGLAQIAALRSPKNGLTMSLISTEPGVQFYSAAPLNCPAPGLDGQRYGAHAGLALEPQAFPDSPNRRHFTDCVLRPDDEYLHVSEFRFA